MDGAVADVAEHARQVAVVVGAEAAGPVAVDAGPVAVEAAGNIGDNVPAVDVAAALAADAAYAAAGWLFLIYNYYVIFISKVKFLLMLRSCERGPSESSVVEAKTTTADASKACSSEDEESRLTRFY